MDEINCEGLYVFKDDDYVPYVLTNKPTILVGLPGVFTPHCTNVHLAGYVNNIHRIKQYNIKVVFICAGYDPSVTNAYKKMHGHSDIEIAADPLSAFTTRYNQTIDFGPSMGVRSKRYAWLVENKIKIHDFLDKCYAEDVIKYYVN